MTLSLPSNILPGKTVMNPLRFLFSTLVVLPVAVNGLNVLPETQMQTLDTGPVALQAHNLLSETLDTRPVAVHALNFLPEAQRMTLEKIDVGLLPINVQKLVLQYNRTTIHTKGPNEENWCCKITPMKTIIRTSSQLVYTHVSQQAKRYTHCGLFGWGRCSRYHVTYVPSTLYKTVFTTSQVPTTCPEHLLTCCNRYTLIAQHCIPNEKIPEIYQDLIILSGQGVLG